MKFIPLTKKVLVNPDFVPAGLLYRADIIEQLWRKYRFAFVSNQNIQRIILNAEDILYIDDISKVDLSDNIYLYCYAGSKTKITLKNREEIYVTDLITDIFAFIN